MGPETHTGRNIGENGQISNKYEKYYGPGRCLLTVLTYSVYAYSKPRLPPVHKYSSLRSTTHPRQCPGQQAAAVDAALHALSQSVVVKV